MDTILFDIGNVLTTDPWESLLLTPGIGIADRLGIPREAAEAAGRTVWPRFSTDPQAREAEYWAAVEAELGVRIPLELVTYAEPDLLVANPAAVPVLRSLAGAGVRIGIISNNTAFWYPKQAALLDLSTLVDPDLVFVSHLSGVDKVDGLFDVAAAAVEPASTVIVDDRDSNIPRARSAGFGAVIQYAFQ
jgi:FMN phosphatase YigB (HAD superfamily)